MFGILKGKPVEKIAETIQSVAKEIPHAAETELTQRNKDDMAGGQTYIRPAITLISFAAWLTIAFSDITVKPEHYLTLHYILIASVTFYFGDRGARRIIREVRKNNS